MLSGIIQLFVKIKQTAVMKINFRIGECRLSFMRIVPFESRNNVSIDFTEAQPISASYAKIKYLSSFLTGFHQPVSAIKSCFLKTALLPKAEHTMSLWHKRVLITECIKSKATIIRRWEAMQYEKNESGLFGFQ